MTSPVEEALGRCWPQVVAATVRLTRDLDLAEDCAQDAFEKSTRTWADRPPDNPAAWLTTTARNLAVDRIRREDTLRRKLPLLVMERSAGPDDEGHDLLRLLFVCCHPALSTDARLALTLRLLGGLTVPEIAEGLLVKETAVAARITRAKQKIAAAHLPFSVPPHHELTLRLDYVLAVIYLIHTSGHSAPMGERIVRPDLTAKARELAELLCDLMPHEAEAWGLLALCLLDDARADVRADEAAGLVLLPDQDRSRWDGRLLTEGLSAATRALRLGTEAGIGRYTLQAAISGLHARAPDAASTDWAAVLTMYDGLYACWPTPIVALNRAAARSLAPGADLTAVLAALDALAAEPALRHYRYLPATRADVLRRLGRLPEAALAYAEALRLTDDTVERRFLRGRLDECTTAPRETP